MAEILWHNLNIAEIEKIQRTNLKEGLTEKEVVIRKREFGPNELPEKKPPSLFELFFKQFESLLVLILVFAGILALFFGEFTDALAIFLIVLLNAIIGFYQERKASRIFQELKKILKMEAHVIRDKKEKIINAIDLVPGDIVILSAGDKVPADGRIFEAQNLKVNEMVLTGEFLSSVKHSEILPRETILADRENMVYLGTTIEEGIGKMVVTETGKQTELGKIAEMIEKKKEKTPLQKKIKRLEIEIALLVGFLALIVFFTSLTREKNLFLLFETVIAMAVGAIPEGLPVAVTVILAIGVQRILKKQGLIRNLASVETLGSTNIILTDKTLTLTEGKMEISEIIGDQYLALKSAVLSTDAFIENPEESREKWLIRGRPIEKAILEKAIQEGIEKRKENEILKIPFNPINKFSGVIYKENGQKFVYLCGAPERIFAISQINQQTEWEEKLKSLTEKGERVIAAARKQISDNKDFERILKENSFEFLGLISFKDPLRKGVKEAIEVCQQAGMEPIIISGDHKLTVKATAEELGWQVNEENILEGAVLDKLTDKELIQILPKIKIYARTEPRHKMRIVAAWHARKQVVAMTGDGVNDAPALRAADIGIALGSGTEVAKEAADMVLLKDNFSVIKEAIKEGRRVIDNVRKATLFMCAECFSEIVLVFGAFLCGLPLPILPVQILWQNLIEGSPQGMAFSFEEEEKGIMVRKPEDPKKPILTHEIKYLILFGGFLTDIILFLFFFILFKFFNWPIETLRTFCFVGLAFGSFCYAFSCKNFRKNIWEYNIFSNKVLNLTLILGFLLLLVAVYFPPFQFLLKTVPLGPFEWLILILFGLINLFLFEITKFFLKRKRINKNY